MKSNLNNFGVRKYESFSGRFTSIDPFWEKYYDWSPYVYSGNNPVTLLDPTGTIVIAMDENSRENIKNSVESDYRDLIDFKDDGAVFLRKDPLVAPMSKDNRTFTNIGALKYLIEHKEIIEVSENSFFKFIHNDQNGNFYKMTYNIDEAKGNGITLIKKSTNENNTSIQDVNQVIISPNNYDTNLTGNNSKGNTTAHELYGHMFLFLWGPLNYKGHEGKTREHIIKAEENQRK